MLPHHVSEEDQDSLVLIFVYLFFEFCSKKGHDWQKSLSNLGLVGNNPPPQMAGHHISFARAKCFIVEHPLRLGFISTDQDEFLESVLKNAANVLRNQVVTAKIEGWSYFRGYHNPLDFALGTTAAIAILFPQGSFKSIPEEELNYDLVIEVISFRLCMPY
jgi:hypothetical protein